MTIILPDKVLAPNRIPKIFSYQPSASRPRLWQPEKRTQPAPALSAYAWLTHNLFEGEFRSMIGARLMTLAAVGPIWRLLAHHAPAVLPCRRAGANNAHSGVWAGLVAFQVCKQQFTCVRTTNNRFAAFLNGVRLAENMQRALTPFPGSTRSINLMKGV